MIVATAGHVDHGKTELIRALTGVDTDRLPEEKARGLSIDIGFAYQPLDDGAVIGYVDVPGHEKFVRNMLAGVGGIDLGLLVVAADDGVMPQTREHSAILDLLGIDECLVALTKIDKVGRERLSEVRAQIDDLLAGTHLAGARVFEVCAPQREGVDDLHAQIVRSTDTLSARATGGHFRLAVDRSFTLKGIGLVVTGTVFSGRVAVDDQLVVSPRGLPLRVRSIRAHDRPADHAIAGERCALNVVGRGVSESSLVRGDWIVHEDLHRPTDRVDVQLTVLATEPRSLKHWTPVHVHHGAHHSTARVAVLEGGAIEPGARGRVQLVLSEPAAMQWGDRLVIRDQSAQRTVGGGRVVDPFSPKRGRARPERLAWLDGMSMGNHAEALQRMLVAIPAGTSIDAFRKARNLTVAELDDALKDTDVVRTGRGEDQRAMSAESWAALQSAMVHHVGRYHAEHPDVVGPNSREVRLGVQPRVPEDVVDQALRQAVSDARLSQRGQAFHLPGHEVRLTAKDEELWKRVSPVITTRDGSPPSLQQAADVLGVDRKLLEGFFKRAVKAGRVTQIARNRYISIETLDQLSTVLDDVAGSYPEGFTAAQYRDASGLGRNFVIDLLEHFDRVGVSERFENVRRLKRQRRSPAN